MSQSELISIERNGGVAVLRLSGTEEKIAVLTLERMEALGKAFTSFASDKSLQGLVIIGSAEHGFCAGADVSLIQSIKDSKRGEELARRGQDVFDKLAALNILTVAAISGACVGGGCEMVLACKWRVILDSPESKIGLPEIKLGIIPGFGGTQRLPRLIGVPAALDIILAGKVLPAARARKTGLVDELVTPASTKQDSYKLLESRAVAIAQGKVTPIRKSVPLAQKLMGNNPVGRSIVSSKARAGVMQETKGHYPAPLKAIDVVLNGLAAGMPAGLKEEARVLGEMAVTPVCNSLIQIYFLTESAGKLGKSARSEITGAKIGVLGAGVMGAGIAASFLGKGHEVVVLEPQAEARDRGKKHIEESIAGRRSLDDAARQALLTKLKLTDSMNDLKDCALVIEAIVEDLKIKQEVLSKLSLIVSADAIIASNTSSLAIGDLVQGVTQASRVVGMHFFNPAEKMPLVEVVRGPQTSPRALAYACAMATNLGKYPVIVEDVPGFLVNRVLSPYIAEAGKLLSEGFAIKDIDRTATDFGMPMGPFRMLDEVGLDVAAKVQEIITGAYGERMKAPEYPKRLAEQKHLGRKSGAGFYRYEGKTELPNREIYSQLGLGSPKQLAQGDAEAIRDRLTLALVNEAVRCLDEEVAGMPGPEAAGQIDLATVMGMGFPPFRGGVLFYAQTLGAHNVLSRMEKLAKTSGPRFAPAPGIRARSAEHKAFSAGTAQLTEQGAGAV